MPGHRRGTDVPDQPTRTGHPQVPLWFRRTMAAMGAVVVALTAITVGVMYQQASYSYRLTEWEDCRITAITKSTVTDDLIGAILDANRRIQGATSFDGAKVPRRELDTTLNDLQRKRTAALNDQAECGPRPVDSR